MFRYCLILVLALGFSQTTFCQTDEIIKSKRIKEALYINVVDPTKQYYVVDKDNPKTKHEKSFDDPILLSADDKFNLMVKFLNPLKYSFSVTESSTKDPMVESVNNFFSSIVSIINMVQPAEKASLPGAPVTGTSYAFGTKAYEQPNATYINPASGKVAATLKYDQIALDLIPLIKSESLLDVAVWVLNSSNVCFSIEQKVALIKSFAQCDDEFFKFNKQAGGLLKAMQDVGSIAQLTPDKLTGFNSAIEELDKINNNTTSGLGAINAAVNAITFSSSSFCDVFKPFLKNKLNTYANVVSPIIEKRKKLINDFKGLAAVLEEIQKSSDSEYYRLQEVKIESGMIKDVQIKIVSRNITVNDNGLIVTEADYATLKIRVREYSAVALEVSAGVLYTNLKYDKYGTETSGTTIRAVKAGEEKISFSAATMLNMIFNAGKSFVYPMAQLGIGTGNKYPIIFVGGGGRFIKPLKHFAFSIGPVWTWKQELQIEENSIISGTADLEKNLKYVFDTKPSLYLGFHYTF